MKNKNSAAVLAFLLGGVGVHKFYLGEIGWGITYAMFFWTYIPTIAGFVEAMILLSMPQDDFDYKYNHKALLGYASRRLTHTSPNHVTTGDQSTANRYNTHTPPTAPPQYTRSIAAEAIDRRILKLCQLKGEVTLLDCFLEIEDIPKDILEQRLEHLVRAEFLQIGNRATDGKVIYRLDN